MIGIYKFTSKITGLSYIGQSIHIETRYQEHLAKMNDDNSKWHKALTEQGINNFDFSVLEECSVDKLNEREIYWINYYNSFYNGYNSTPGGQSKYFNPQLIYDGWDAGLSPLEISEQLNISTSCVYNNLIGYKNYDKHIAKVRGGQLARKKVLQNNDKIFQYDLDDNFIKAWDSCKEIIRENPTWDSSYIGKVLNGNRSSAYKYQWKKFYVEKLPSYKNTSGISRPVIQYDLLGNQINEFESLADASRNTHCDASLIKRVCNQPDTRTAGGYKWRWKT